MNGSLLNLPNPASEQNGEWKVVSPAQTDKVIGTCVYRYSDVDLAVKGAWTHSTRIAPADRWSVIQKAQELLREKKPALFEVAKLELGRTSFELDLEWRALDDYLSSMVADRSLANENTEARGVSIVLGSYVWPIFYSVQFAIVNFLAGNPVILKPSEKSTLTVSAVVGMLRAMPELQTIQLVVGDREVGRRLATHEGIATVLFQGSFEVGMRVKQDCLSQPGKEVLLYLGSKNAGIVFEDAKAVVEETLLRDAFLGAGQHCRSISVIFVQKARLEKFSQRFHELSKAFKIGGPSTDGWMGPLIDGAILDRYLKFIGISEREGAELLMRGKLFTGSEKGHFVTPTIATFSEISAEKIKKSVSLQTEILSPHVSIVGFESEAELTILLEQMSYGRLAAVWTSDLKRAKRIAESLPVGEVVVNRSSLEFPSWSTTQARKRSGNHAFLGRGLWSQLVFTKQIRIE